MEERNWDLKYRFEEHMFNNFKRDVYIRKTENAYEISDWGFAGSNPTAPVVFMVPLLDTVEDIVNYITNNYPELFL